MTIHVAKLGQYWSACGAEGTVITWVEAMKPEGRPFDCPECHKALTGGRRHAEPEGEDQ